MRRLVLGTAGHIDHGKTALVAALTGTDTDRLPEEKRRGITIDLGFARLPLGADLELALVDVPGHEGFVRNMVAGATGMDLVLLVVAADEGVMPQTREHLAILDLLAVRGGIVVLTKADLVDEDWLELVRDDVADTVRGSVLEHAPVVPASTRTGEGLDRLRELISAAAIGTADRACDDLFRMPIDRAFSIRGTGTVVTGTVWSGVLRADQHVRIEPLGRTARVRTLHQHGEVTDNVVAGSRAAVALPGLDPADARRGHSLVLGDGWAASAILTVDMHVIPGAGAAVRPRQRVRVLLGTSEVIARVAMIDSPVEPGANRLAQLRLESPLLARAGDRFVIRSWSPVHTIAGGVIVEVLAPRRKRLTPRLETAFRRLARPESAIGGALQLAGTRGLPLADLPVRTGLSPAAVERDISESITLLLAGGHVFHAPYVEEAEAFILRQLTGFHREQPLHDGLDRDRLRQLAGSRLEPVFDLAVDRLVAAGSVRHAGNEVALAGHRPTPTDAQREALAGLAALFRAAGLAPPSLDELPPAFGERGDLLPLLRHLEREDRLVRLSADRWCDRDALRTAAVALRAALRPDTPYGLSRYREVLGVSRKHLIPTLEFFDRVHVTARRLDHRILLPHNDSDPPLAPGPAA